MGESIKILTSFNLSKMPRLKLKTLKQKRKNLKEQSKNAKFKS